MADNITCTVCGGTDFHIESGFYYCNECQTQSQDVEERVFENVDVEDAIRKVSSTRSAKKIRTVKKTKDQLTSWECYNYVLRGLVGELIELGANVSLKKTVHLLWFRYLKKLEVINTKNETPKLGGHNSKIDAEIIYGRPQVRRKRKKATNPQSETSSDETVSSRQERTKRKRSLVLSTYDEYNSTLQSEGDSLANQSLQSLRSEQGSLKEENILQYNRYVKKEFLKYMGKSHLKKHRRDINSEQTCHKITKKSFSPTYYGGPVVLMRNKIYAVIYLGLLINKDNIQLGDLLRFIREGHLSFHNVLHFFPEDCLDKVLNLRRWNDRQHFLTHLGIRKTTAQIAHFLDVTSYVPIQDIVQLCRRYCKELNLPDEVLGYCINLFAKVPPRMKFNNKTLIIPNYEGRAISTIIFILKLMFGMDNQTEHHFSKLAQDLNACPEFGDEKMFVWDDWIHYLYYRKLLLIQHHFPTQNSFADNDDVQNTNLAVNFLNDQYAKCETDLELTKESEILHSLLKKCCDKHCQLTETITFPPSLTPFRSYSEILVKSKIASKNNYLIDVLQSNYDSYCFNFLVKPFHYLETLYKTLKIEIKHGGMNNSIEFVDFKNLHSEKDIWRAQMRKDVLVKLTSDPTPREKLLLRKFYFNLEESKTRKNSKQILENYGKRNSGMFEKHTKKLLKTFKREQKEFRQKKLQSDLEDNSTTSSQNNVRKKSPYVHYNPYERHWLKYLETAEITKYDFDTFVKSFPQSFQLVFNECARMTEQDRKELLLEFCDVEIYFSYVGEFSKLDRQRHNITNRQLSIFISKIKKCW
ncbi:hypothetical protein FQA39_LY01196 [Lamprigera yunnana]|nr:hypothetical protein FQA39_LY01196 [Lamprigera yunnana]